MIMTMMMTCAIFFPPLSVSQEILDMNRIRRHKIKFAKGVQWKWDFAWFRLFHHSTTVRSLHSLQWQCSLSFIFRPYCLISRSLWTEICTLTCHAFSFGQAETAALQMAVDTKATETQAVLFDLKCLLTDVELPYNCLILFPCGEQKSHD